MAAAQKRPRAPGGEFGTPPLVSRGGSEKPGAAGWRSLLGASRTYDSAPLLTRASQLVLNNFGSQEKHVKLLVTVFQGLFPPIQVQSVSVMLRCS